MIFTNSIFLCLYFAISFTNGAKILYLMPMASKSHRFAFNPLITELANRGHQVSVVSPFSMLNQENIKEIVISDEAAVKALGEEMMKKIESTIGLHPILTAYGFKYFIEPTCLNYLKNPQTKELLKAGKQFDLVIVSMLMNDCALATAPLLGKNIMYHSTSPFVTWKAVFAIQPPSYLPFALLPYTSKMSFLQRLDNFVTLTVIDLVFDVVVFPVIERHVKEYFPQALSITEARKLVTLSLMNVDSVLVNPKPTMTNVINVGGLHCGRTKAIPSEFENFIQKAGDDGVILFSLGSNFPSSALSKEKVEEILKAFGKLKQNVIWKYEKELESHPPNVKISKWLPQQDLLAHPKMRILITHGGLLSLQEAVYHGVPVIAIPLFADQPTNVARVEELGIGRRIDYHNISGEAIYEAITGILNDKSYKENAKKYSQIFRDKSQDPLELAVYWVEYVIRHGGADHFRSAGEDLNFFQYYLLDVIGLLCVVVLLVMFLFYSIVKLALSCVFQKNKSTSRSVKEKKQ